jgi:hypothetical protein
LVTALRRAARERGGALPSIDVADALLDERRERAVNGAATGSAEVGSAAMIGVKGQMP